MASHREQFNASQQKLVLELNLINSSNSSSILRNELVIVQNKKAP